jgi:hypothetical protein
MGLVITKWIFGRKIWTDCADTLSFDNAAKTTAISKAHKIRGRIILKFILSLGAGAAGPTAI